MVVDICLGISEKLVRQMLVGRKLVDVYLTDVPGGVRLNTAECLRRRVGGYGDFFWDRH